MARHRFEIYPVSQPRPLSEKGTPRGQRPVAAVSLPRHPPLSPPIRGSANKTGPAPRSLWVGLRVEIRGGSDAPCGRKRRPKSGRRLSPAGRRSPLAAILSWRLDRRDCMEPAEARRTSAHAADCDYARLRAAIVRTCSAASRFRALRAPRPRRDGATLTRPPRARGMAIVGASRNHEREHTHGTRGRP